MHVSESPLKVCLSKKKLVCGGRVICQRSVIFRSFFLRGRFWVVFKALWPLKTTQPPLPPKNDPKNDFATKNDPNMTLTHKATQKTTPQKTTYICQIHQPRKLSVGASLSVSRDYHYNKCWQIFDVKSKSIVILMISDNLTMTIMVPDRSSG